MQKPLKHEQKLVILDGDKGRNCKELALPTRVELILSANQKRATGGLVRDLVSRQPTRLLPYVDGLYCLSFFYVNINCVFFIFEIFFYLLVFLSLK